MTKPYKKLYKTLYYLKKILEESLLNKIFDERK